MVFFGEVECPEDGWKKPCANRADNCGQIIGLALTTLLERL
jgi:hypothetical protein